MNVVRLDVDEIPKKWYNIASDLPEQLPPPLNPGTKAPLKPEEMEAIFPKEIIRQEMSQEKFIDIPEELIEIYSKIGRPSPLFRATRLEKALNTPAKIYFKREDLSPGGSHKTNTAIAQAYYSMKEGVENLTTETGAGQWGTALSLSSALFGLKTTVFMVKCSYEQKPLRRMVMHTYGADVHPSPSTVTEIGRKILKENPEHPGTLGTAISEAIFMAVQDEKTKYGIGSVLNHVLLHQTVIGEEVLKQMEKLDESPDYMVGCVGGGSNFGGFTYPMIREKLKGKNNAEFIAVEPQSVPTLTKGEYRYDFGDTAELTPLLKMHTLGYKFIPPDIHAGGLRYHGDAPTLSVLVKNGMVKPISYHQNETFEAGLLFAKTEGIIPAPETTHAVKAAIDLALEAKKNNEEKIIVFNFSGHGLLDMAGYDKYISGHLKDY